MRSGLLFVAISLALSACVTRTPAPVVDRKPPPASAAPVVPEPAPAPAPVAVEPPPPPPPPQQPDWRPEFYTVKRGDTLFQIALEHGLDYRELAALNNIENINVIRVGQVLRVRAPAPPDAQSPVAPQGPATAPLVTVPPVTDAKAVAAVRNDRPNTDNLKTQPKAIRLPYSEAAFAQLQQGGSPAAAGNPPASGSPGGPPATAASTGSPPASAASNAGSGSGSVGGGGGGAAGAGAAGTATGAAAGAGAVGPLASAPSSAGPQPGTPGAIVPPPATPEGEDQVDWSWPVKGRIVSGYSESASLKGIDIAGTKGMPVTATAAGRVVYAGSGLRGYGKLVIVKHNKTYLSAYAHLDDISIREGQNVARGQQIGKMGSTDADQVKLHFEIRSLGKPVDPMRFLPRS